MVEEQLKTDINLLQSQTNSSENLQDESAGASNIASSSSNVELPSFQHYRSRSNLDVWNIDLNSSPSTRLENESLKMEFDDINSLSSLHTSNNENLSASHIENESPNTEFNANEKFILNDESSDSDNEITCNEDTRKTDSDLGADDDEFSNYSYGNETIDNATTFHINLRKWALRFHITLVALTALLLLLRVFDATLPLDARTLLGTLRKTENIEMCGGDYHHFGLQRAIENILRKRKQKGVQDKNIKLMFNVDGVPISKSGSNSFWLILCSEMDSETVFPVGAFYGTKKPVDANEFLDLFVQEAIKVCKNGVKNCNVSIEGIVCDAPAKSFVLYLKGHTGYDCCSKCLITGECHRPVTKTGKKKKGRVCFPGIGPFSLKNDQDFLLNKYNTLQSDVQTVLTKLPGFGCISSIPLDYMHLILLGVTKKLISLWVLGKSKVRLPADVLNTISNRLLLLRNTIPDEFNRKPRSLWEYKFWKATEFRTFLLYAGVVVLKNVKGFPNEIYSHFLLLHTSISILSSQQNICDPRNIDAAHEMLQLFVKQFESLYGKEFISYNVHNLLHICEDVKRYGSLGNFSAFKYENYMSTVKRMIRKGDRPLQQLARRYAEVEDMLNNTSSIEELILKQPHNSGPLTQDFLSNIPEQYKVLESKGFTIKCTDMKNNCVMLKDGTFLTVENIVKFSDQDIRLIGQKLCLSGNLYDEPDSRLLSIYIAHAGNKDGKIWVLLTDVISKVWKIPTSEGSVVIPLLHRKE